MNRLLALTLLFACPAAHAQQEDYAEGMRLAEAFSQADLDALGRCQARIEGGVRMHDELAGWLEANGQTSALEAVRKMKANGVPLIESFTDVRMNTAKAKGMDGARSEAARQEILKIFVRQPGEDERAAYLRWQPESMLTSDCAPALKRGRWKVEIEELAGKE